VRIWVFAYGFNEVAVLPFWLRHYSAFADQIHVWDDHSTDGTRELLAAHPKVVLHDWPGTDGMDEEMNLELAHASYPLARGHADWVMWPDMDEFLYHPDMHNYLAGRKAAGREAIYAWGYNMIAENGLPPDDGKSQIWELLRTGVHAPVYSKPIIFQPHIDLRWARGKHHLYDGAGSINVGPVPQWFRSDEWEIKLLHYRYLGVEYTRARNRRNYARFRMNTGDKGQAWAVSENYRGEGSPEWVVQVFPGRYDVVDAAASYEGSPVIPRPD
jgi:hypothetical protein